MAEITLVAPGGIRTALQKMLPDFETKTGHKVTPTYISGGQAKAKIVEGELFDVPIVQPPLDTVIASGNVIAATETPLATVSVVAAVRAGTPKPDISTADALKKTLLAAKSISCPSVTRGAACGVSFEATLKKLGIADAITPKIKPAQSGWNAIVMLAEGQVEFGITFASENEPDDRVQMLGALPRDVSIPTGFVAFINAKSTVPEAAAALIAFLATPAAAAIFHECGMTPGK